MITRFQRLPLQVVKPSEKRLRKPPAAVWVSLWCIYVPTGTAGGRTSTGQCINTPETLLEFCYRKFELAPRIKLHMRRLELEALIIYSISQKFNYSNFRLLMIKEELALASGYSVWISPGDKEPHILY
ncbi:hypothetical protein PGTUg99_027692 [Puccinia graminis f. sp. tritici]|uniref:Uncharacterized protein n=1 Tax=Puccinia graminis f. sp. tritici TaxID=56615 RepID=A0A5B0LT80_PUCGR|nr:hypothetical protein PGTUg99_027692 [Puccinia graminis f. sp. tritici]